VWWGGLFRIPAGFCRWHTASRLGRKYTTCPLVRQCSALQGGHGMKGLVYKCKKVRNTTADCTHVDCTLHLFCRAPLRCGSSLPQRACHHYPMVVVSCMCSSPLYLRRSLCGHCVSTGFFLHPICTLIATPTLPAMR